MMKASDRYLLAIIGELEPATYGAISLQSQAPDYYLGPKLDDLIDRGFIHAWNGQYRLSKGVKESLLPG